MKKLIIFTSIISSLSIYGQELILNPIGNNQYELVPLNEIIPKNTEKIEKIIEIEKIKEEDSYKENIHFTPNNIYSLEDTLILNFSYDYRKFKTKKSKNIFQNTTTTNFINTIHNKKVDEDLYVITVNSFNSNNKINKTKLDDYGASLGFTYGYSSNLDIGLYLGYSNTKIEKSKSNFLGATKLSYYLDNNNNTNLGVILGYEHSKNKCFNTKNQFIGILSLETQKEIIDNLNLKLGVDSTYYSTRIRGKLKQKIEIFDNFDFNVGLSSEYVFASKKGNKKNFNFNDYKKVPIKLSMEAKTDSFNIEPYYEFINKQVGIAISYKF